MAASASARFTEANIGNRLAVVLDNQIVSVATIQSKIEDQGRITGLGSEQEASIWRWYLRSGSLPAGIEYLEERTVGPVARRRFDPRGHRGRHRRTGRGGRRDAGLLQAERHQRGAGADSEHGHPDGGALVLRRGADAARHRRRHSDHRYGGRFATC